MEWEEKFASIVKETEENIAKVRWQLERKPSEIGSSVDWLPSPHQGYTREGSPVDFVYANIAESAVDWEDITGGYNTSSKQVTAHPAQHVARPHIQRRFSDSYNMRRSSDTPQKRPWSSTPASSTPKSHSWKHRLHSSIPSSSLIENDTYGFVHANSSAPATRTTPRTSMSSPVPVSARQSFAPSPRVSIPTAVRPVFNYCPLVPVTAAPVEPTFNPYPITSVCAPVKRTFSPYSLVSVPAAVQPTVNTYPIVSVPATVQPTVNTYPVVSVPAAVQPTVNPCHFVSVTANSALDPYPIAPVSGNIRNWTSDDRMDQQNKMIKHLSDMVQRLQTEREQTHIAHQQLKGDVDHMLTQVNHGNSLSTQRCIEHWRREMMTEMELMRSQIHMNRTTVPVDDGNTLTDNHYTKLTQEILQLRRQMTDEMDQVRKEFEILKTRIVKTEVDLSAMKMSKRDLEKKQHKINQALCELSDGALSQNKDVCQVIHDHGAEKRQMSELSCAVSSIRNKLASMEEYLDLHTPRTVRVSVDRTGKEIKSANTSSNHVKKPRSRHTYDQKHAPPPEWMPDDWSSIDLADYSSSDFDVSLPARASQPVNYNFGEFHLDGLDLTDDEIERRPMSDSDDLDMDSDTDPFLDDMR